MQVISMTFDKYVAIKWPHKAATFSTPRRAKFTIAIVWFCVVVYNIPHLIFTKWIGDLCAAYAVGGVLTKVHSWTTFALNGAVAFLVLIYMNYVIIKKVRSSRTMFGGNKCGQSQSKNSVAFSRREKAMKNTENQLTIMLLLVTTLFIILMIPTSVRFLYTSFVKRDTPVKYTILWLLYCVSQALYFTNNGVNFF